ncbi:MAG: hypothetical protein ACP5VF_13005, partial [Acidobacteriota bacterium]
MTPFSTVRDLSRLPRLFPSSIAGLGKSNGLDGAGVANGARVKSRTPERGAPSALAWEPS